MKNGCKLKLYIIIYYYCDPIVFAAAFNLSILQSIATEIQCFWYCLCHCYSQMTMFSLLSEIKQEARDILERRILAGEEQTHQVIKGVVGYVAGLGQYSIDARNVLNGVDGCFQVGTLIKWEHSSTPFKGGLINSVWEHRNRMINDLLSNQAEIPRWETAQNLLKSEYNVDMSESIEISKFV
jgi:hypothetical protein